MRSEFVHGRVQKARDNERLAEKYGTVRKLIGTILDFLRLAIIVSISAGAHKAELIKTIDESLLDEKGEEKLKTLLRYPIEILKDSI